MRTTWIVLVSREKARVLEQRGGSPELMLLTEVVNPAGVLGGSDVPSSRADHETAPHYWTTDGTRGGFRAGSEKSSAKEKVLRRLCSTVAGFLEQAVRYKAYDDLVIVAEPHMLGLIRQHLDSEVVRHVSSYVKKNLCDVPARELPAVLRDVLPCSAEIRPVFPSRI